MLVTFCKVSPESFAYLVMPQSSRFPTWLLFQRLHQIVLPNSLRSVFTVVTDSSHEPGTFHRQGDFSSSAFV